MYQQAIRALDAKDIKAATNMFNRVIEFYPTSEEANKARTQLNQIGGVVEVDVNKEPDVALTTAFYLEGYKIIKTIEIVTAECVFGMNLFRDFFAAVTDIFGGRSNATQQILRDARKICLRGLKDEAHSVGANAVISVTLNYSELSGQGKSMLFLVAAGTAVIVEPISSVQKIVRS
jgi:uncharacterized protein YbjQ (UPF0145 family)